VPGLPPPALGAEVILAHQLGGPGQPGRLQRGAVPGQPGPAGPQLARPADDADALVPELEQQGLDQLERDGIAPGAARIARSADIRYKGQINEVEVAVPAGRLDDAALAELAADFHRRYESLYGAGAGFREARVEIVTYRVRTTAVSAKPAIRPTREQGATPSDDARAGARPVYWAELGDFELTPVWWGERLVAGNRVAGPAIIQVPDTTIVVHPGQAARIDAYGNVLVDLTVAS